MSRTKFVKDPKTGEVKTVTVELTKEEADALNPVVDNEAINLERERRINAGMTVNVSGIGPFNIQTRKQDRENIAGLAQMAGLRLVGAIPSGDVVFRDADDIDRTLNPGHVISMGAQMAAQVDALYKASWAIKAKPPKRSELATDARWP